MRRRRTARGVAFAGSVVTARRHQARDLIVPIKVIGDTPDDVDASVEALAEAIDPLSGTGDVTITVGRPDGSARQISATYLAGLEAIPVAFDDSTTAFATLAFRATDPYWRSVEPTTVQIDPPTPVFTSGSTAFDEPATFSSGDLPFDGYQTGVLFDAADVLFSAPALFDGGGAGSVLFNVVNDGDVDVWPAFRFTGPASLIEVSNVTTGKTWSIPDGLAAGEVILVDTNPRTVRVLAGGANAYGRLGDGSELWPLPPGESLLVLRMDGAVDGGTTSWTDDTDLAWVDDTDLDWLTDSAGGSSAASLGWTPRWLTC